MDVASPPFEVPMSATLSTVETSPALAAALPPSAVINELSIRVGTVNGSGSQSANLVLLRALYAMGIPCSGKNVFPSNIEGLPTWFHIRASAKGYVGHRLDPQILVCMNEPDRHGRRAGNSNRALSASIARTSTVRPNDLRDDVIFFAVPFQKLVEEAYPPDNKDKGYRDKLRKVINMVYVGVLAALCDIRMDAVEAAFAASFPAGKAKAAEINIARGTRRLRLGAGTSAGRPSLSCRADGVDPGQDPDRGEQGCGTGRPLRRGERAGLVSDHAL